MQVSKKNLSDTEVVLTIIAKESELQALKEHVLEHFAGKVKLAGFRSGKAPLALVEKNVDPDALQSEFLEEAITSLYEQAAVEQQLRVVQQPEVTLKKFVPYSTLEFEAKVFIISKVKLPDYKKISVPRPSVTVSPDEVEGVIKSLQKRLAEKKEVSRAAMNGDEVVIDFTGTDKDGKPISGADAKDYPLTLGSNSFIPGFEDNLVGLKPKDSKTFDITFPKDYGVKALASKIVTFVITLHKVLELDEPKVDDAFAAKASPFATVKELKADIKKQVAIEKQSQAEKEYESDLVKAITAKSKIAVPKVLVDDTVERLLQEVKQNIVYRGQTYQEFLDLEGKTDEQYRKELEPNAQERVKASLVLAEIADVEKLDVSLEELEVRIQSLKGQYQDKAMQSELDKPDNRRDVASRMLTEKVLQLLKQ